MSSKALRVGVPATALVSTVLPVSPDGGGGGADDRDIV